MLAAVVAEAPAPVVRLTAEQMFATADRLVGAGRAAEAGAVLQALTQDPRLPIRNEARFRLARLKRAEGDRQSAATLLEALLAEQPEAQPARVELALVRAELGDEVAARRELRRAGAAGLPEEVARTVDRFAAALRSRQRLGGSFEVALAPDTNINRATDARQVDTVIAPFELDEDARATSGIGVSLAGQGFGRVPLGRHALLARLSGRANLYGKGRFNDVTASLAAGPEFNLGPVRLRPAATMARRWFGNARYADYVGASINLLTPLSLKSQVEVEATWLDGRYAQELQDGDLWDATIAYDRALTPRLSGRVAVRGTRQEAQVPGLATWSGSLDLLGAYQWRQVAGFAQLGIARVAADGRQALFPGVRKDWRLDVTAGLVARRWQWRGLSPLLRTTWTGSWSTLALYDYRRLRLEAGLSRDF